MAKRARTSDGPAPEGIDITAPDVVELAIRHDGKVIWANVNGECKLRCCRIKRLNIDDRRPKKVLSDDGKQDIALALLLLKDFKSDGKFDVALTESIMGLAKYLGVDKQFLQLLSKLPPMKIEPRF